MVTDALSRVDRRRHRAQRTAGISSHSQRFFPTPSKALLQHKQPAVLGTGRLACWPASSLYVVDGMYGAAASRNTTRDAPRGTDATATGKLYIKENKSKKEAILIDSLFIDLE